MLVSLKLQSGKKNLYHSVSHLFPLTYMCVDIDSRSFSDDKAEKIPLRHEKTVNVVVITFFCIKLRCRCSVIDGYSNPTDEDYSKVSLVQ